MLIWNEHVDFSKIYTIEDTKLSILNTIFIALVIFYVYPLRFLTLFLTNLIFQTDIEVSIQGEQVPYLMIYYGFVAFALYFILFLFYQRAYQIKEHLQLNAYEVFFTQSQKQRLLIMFIVPLISIIITVALFKFSFVWASFLGGVTYIAYTPLILWWHSKFTKEAKQFLEE
ncbi:hypothetical protein [Mongoliitalea daihaiensis]|uniref:hypothetical protein n=1 Tax=Mongoliitalea daihaiensis TaxID=2782006 RepID=UPI001F4162BD|nr:hypothetical protein [Mongoliitalea daihaiensis]UJP65112.1 hypothetical protein IPZ59_00265 [Mongoliitalea daihaiensis]